MPPRRSNEAGSDTHGLLSQLILDQQVQRVVEVVDQAGQVIPRFGGTSGYMSASELQGWLLRMESELIASLRAGSVPSLAAAREFGARCFEVNISLADLQQLRRLAEGVDWQYLLAQTEQSVKPAEVVLQIAVLYWDIARQIDEDITAAYHDMDTRRTVRRAERNAVLVDCLVRGILSDPDAVFAKLNELCIDSTGRYCIVVAPVQIPGDPPLSQIEELLRRESLSSAWQLASDAQIGIVAIRNPQNIKRLKMVLRSREAACVGISVPVSGLELPIGRRLAHLACATVTDRSPVAMFGDDVSLSALAAASPEVVRMLSARNLGRIFKLPKTARDQLFETFERWLEYHGSVRQTAQALRRHPNTIRYRLAKIQELTNRTLSSPRDVADLTLLIRFERSRADLQHCRAGTQPDHTDDELTDSASSDFVLGSEDRG